MTNWHLCFCRISYYYLPISNFTPFSFHVLKDNNQAESKAVLEELEHIDDEADNVGISVVKINDLELVDEYNLGQVPALVYYRYTTPVIFQGDLTNEQTVLEWLIQNRSVGDEEDVIEEVDSKTLRTMVTSIENLAVLFCKFGSSELHCTLEIFNNIFFLFQMIQNQEKLISCWRVWRK